MSAADKALALADVETTARVVDSLVLRGDLSGLAPADRARYYVQMCEGLGLNPHSQPFAYLRLNGKEILYAGRGATDQLAAIHRVNREIVDGPKVIDLAGTKLVYAVCRASLPNGRIETATATVPLTDPVNVLMKAETKAKRRATLSILGLGMLDETEIEIIPAHVKSHGEAVNLSPTAALASPAPSPLDALREALADAVGVGQLVATYHRHARALHDAGEADEGSAAACQQMMGALPLTVTDARALLADPSLDGHTGEMFDALAEIPEHDAAGHLAWWRAAVSTGDVARVPPHLLPLLKRAVAKSWALAVGGDVAHAGRDFAAALIAPTAGDPAEVPTVAPPAPADGPSAYERAVAAVTTPAAAVDVWRSHRGSVAGLPTADRTAAWGLLAARHAAITGAGLRAAKADLKALVGDADRASGSLVCTEGTVLATPADVAAYLAGITARQHLEAWTRKHARHPLSPGVDAITARLVVIDAGTDGTKLTPASARATVAGWVAL